jgi:drug/metabolite transporter (DMT)-like permease
VKDGVEPDSTDKLWADASLVGVALIWGINMPIMKIGLDQLDPFVFNTIRLCISAICLAALAFRERNNGIFPAPDICGRQIVTYGILVS